MFEVIISSVRTGKVIRKLVDSRDDADRFFERFLLNPRGLRPRNQRDYRVEVVFRDGPELVARLSSRLRRPAAVSAA